MPSETVINLRKQLRERFPAAHRSEVARPQEPGAPTGTEPLRCDSPQAPASPSTPGTRHLLDVGFPPGAITEISPSHPTCGISLLVSTLLASERENAPHAGLPLALIDARDQFDPDSFSHDDCRKILWLRCRETQQALHAADLLLRDGNLPLVLLDLSSLPARELQRIPRSSWHRLRQLAESTQATLLALTPSPCIPGTALRLTLTQRLTLADLLFPRRQLQDSLTNEVTRRTPKALTA
jgi:hypothetical protein